jgi:hypothetical protein
MAAGDYAILVGIKKYADESTFPELKGPPNDVALFTEWLTAADGGDVDPANIITIVSPPAIPPSTDPDSFPPVTEAFKLAFKKLVRDNDGHFLSRPGRLYLYFSGHGFCEKKSLTAQATLYAANATREFPENIYGTYYALQVRDKALFSEVVLIMDCCRDAEATRPPDVPPINEAGSGAAGDVKLFCAYAAPKGGKAQERVIEEREKKVYGLLTHALLKALKEARPDAGTCITGAALKRHLLETWNALCGDVPAPMPEIVPPSGIDIQFRSQNTGINQGFQIADFPTVPTTMDVLDSARNLVARCQLQPPPATSTVAWNGNAPTNLAFDGAKFALRLQPSFYKYVLSGGLSRDGLFPVEVGGGPDVRL